MAGLFSPTAYKRLPSFIKEMDKTGQDIFILLRLRKGPQHIAHEMGISLEETERRIGSILHTLSCHNGLHLVRNPVFVPIPGEEEEGQAVISDSSITPEEEAILSQFMRYFSDALKQISQEEKNLLKLYFHHQWSMDEISAFYRKAPFPLPYSKRTAEGYSKKDVSSSLVKTIKNLFNLLRRNLGEEDEKGSLKVEGLKTILEEVGGHEELW